MSGNQPAGIAEERLKLAEFAVLSPTRAAELLPARESDALRWLRDRKLIRSVPGLGDVVVWGEGVKAILSGDEPVKAATVSQPARGTLRRGRL